jgi:hypothetical protein
MAWQDNHLVAAGCPAAPLTLLFALKAVLALGMSALRKAPRLSGSSKEFPESANFVEKVACCGDALLIHISP